MTIYNGLKALNNVTSPKTSLTQLGADVTHIVPNLHVGNSTCYSI